MSVDNNVIKLTDSAVKAIKSAMSEDSSVHGIRFGILSGGCQGLTYSVDYVDQPDAADIHNKQDGLDIYIAPNAVLFLEDMTVDYKVSPMGATFVFNNPNAVNRCGCGMSFSTGDGCGSCHGCGCE